MQYCFSRQRFYSYIRLIRLDKPIGILLLLWPTLNALWVGAQGFPKLSILNIFVLGTVLMRSAGCAINDFADRHIDLHVKRTRQRPIVNGKIKALEAIGLAIFLTLLAGVLVLNLNIFTQYLAIAAVVLAATYPFTKRFFSLPQAYLGIAFSMGILMAFTALHNDIPAIAWLMLLANICWVMAYDTEYAMADKADDLKIGIRTSAITFGRWDTAAIAIFYVLHLTIYAVIATDQLWSIWFWAGWIVAGALAIYHLFLIASKLPERCFKAFLHNNWLGASLFLGIATHYLFS